MYHRNAVCMLLVLVAAGSLVSTAGRSTAAPAATTAEGTIESVDGALLVIAGANGRIQVRTAADTRVIRRLSAKLEDIKPGDFIGVAARRETNGSLAAVSINIFPPEMKGVAREGQFPMESGNIMTNAVVTEYVSRVSGRTLTLTHKDGTAVINVPTAAEVHRLVTITPADLKPGQRVTVRGTANADGSLAATSITAEGAAP